MERKGGDSDRDRRGAVDTEGADVAGALLSLGVFAVGSVVNAVNGAETSVDGSDE